MYYLNAFLTNLGKYNEGELVGEWLQLPMEEEEIEEAMKRIGIGEVDEFGQPYEEYFITDYDSYIGEHCYGEYEDIYEINKTVQEIADLVKTEDELKIFEAIYADMGDMDETIKIMRNQDYVIYSDCTTMAQVAEEIVYKTGMLCAVPENIARYFDYEAFGHKLEIEGHFIKVDYEYYIEILD